MDKCIFIFGAGGHAKVVANIAELNSYKILGFVDPFTTKTDLVGKPIFKNLVDLPEGSFSVVVALGDNMQRSKVVREIVDFQGLTKLQFVKLVHPKAIVADSVEIGVGTVVMGGAIINPASVIKEHAIINTGSIVDHDCLIENYASVAPGATLGGNVRILEFSAVSIGAVCKHNIEISKHSVIGANSYVNKNVPEYSVVYGVPAKEIRKRKLGDKYL